MNKINLPKAPFKDGEKVKIIENWVYHDRVGSIIKSIEAENGKYMYIVEIEPNTQVYFEENALEPYNNQEVDKMKTIEWTDRQPDISFDDLQVGEWFVFAEDTWTVMFKITDAKYVVFDTGCLYCLTDEKAKSKSVLPLDVKITAKIREGYYG